MAELLEQALAALAQQHMWRRMMHALCSDIFVVPVIYLEDFRPMACRTMMPLSLTLRHRPSHRINHFQSGGGCSVDSRSLLVSDQRVGSDSFCSGLFFVCLDFRSPNRRGDPKAFVCFMVAFAIIFFLLVVSRSFGRNNL